MSSVFRQLAEKKIVLPYLENAFHNDRWPDLYTITVDSQPYYGMEDENGDTHDGGSGDGYFHPSSHPLMSPRELWFRFHPEHSKTIPPERRTLTSHITLAAGSAMHAVIQTQLNMAKILRKGGLQDSVWRQIGDDIRGRVPEENLYEFEYINDRHKVRGRLDGILDHPAEGDLLFELKALDCSTPILTGSGWSTMGSLRDGDEVYAPDGSLTKVVTAHPIRLGRPCYEVRFRDGQAVVADAEHLWEVTDYRGVVRVLTTEEIARRGTRFSNGYRFTVPVTKPLQAPEADLPVDPWLLGMWLGDGDKSMVSISSGDEDLDYLVSRVEGLGLDYKVNRYGTRAASVYIHGLRGRFVGLCLLGNKHIPQQYMLASEKQRRELLAGIMDSDGTVGGHQVSVGMMNEPLMRQVLQLVRSLGYRATWSEHTARLNGKDCGVCYSVKFSVTHPDSPFAMPRKTSRFDAHPVGRQDMTRNAIVAVAPVSSRPTRCITVAHESSLYVVGEGFVPTHNTQNPRAYRFQENWKDQWYAQVQMGMDNYGLDRAILVLLEMAYPWSVREFDIPRDRDFISKTYEKFDYVRECIEHDIPPVCGHSLGSKEAKACPSNKLCWGE